MGLVLLLKDFVQPVTVVSALVLSVLGAFLALFVAGARSR
jgi:multidrug efflux pump subunit AcrB